MGVTMTAAPAHASVSTPQQPTRELYLDHAATTPLHPAALAALQEVYAEPLANPGSLHTPGRRARRLLDEARSEIAALLGVEPVSVIFTSGGTEADNLALIGRAAAADSPLRILANPTEHPAVRETLAHLLSTYGAQLEWLELDATGRCIIPTPAQLAAVDLVICQWANNETGLIHPVEALAAAPALHIDAVQAIGHIPVDLSSVGDATVALAGHKFGAPVGTGVLIVPRSVALSPQVFGGGQQRNLRSGTQDVAGAVALAATLRAVLAELPDTHARVSATAAQLRAGLATIPGIRLTVAATTPHLPGHVHFLVDGAESDSVLMLLDRAEIAAAAGSACAAGVNRPSESLLAMGIDERAARGAIRMSLGPELSRADCDRVIAALTEIVPRAQAAGMAY